MTAPPEWRMTRAASGDAILSLSGDWVARETGLRDPAAPLQVLREAADASRLCFDTRDLGRWDSALVVFVQALRQAVAEAARPITLDEVGLPQAARRLLTLAAETDAGPPPVAEPRPSPLVRLGQATQRLAAASVAVAALVGDTSLRGVAALAGRVSTRAGDVLDLMREAGAGALGIVAIVNGLVGGILAFVGAVQLRRFGAEIFVADLVGIAMVREMAAVMTAIVMAGRTGGAYAAQLATMQGNEEIDALKALGVPVHDYLILPRVLAMVAMMPLLYIYGCAVGLLGGLTVGMITLDLTPAAYIFETRKAISGTQFMIGLTKSVAFGALVALAGCHIGLRAGRSAADVGKAATSAVVAGIIGVIVLDAIFAICANALGI
jgi:phospholipid/cholesterol/gamma-HCH transport system permease protein